MEFFPDFGFIGVIIEDKVKKKSDESPSHMGRPELL
jgi:hypothetical protein